MEKKNFYELSKDGKILSVYYSFENDEWETKSGEKRFTINVWADKLDALIIYLDACITDDGTSFILWSIKKDLVPAWILTPVKSQLDIKSEALELLIS